jgi:hypothetical protein
LRAAIKHAEMEQRVLVMEEGIQTIF